MRVIQSVEYVVSIIVFVCFVGVLGVLAIDVITSPVQLTTATSSVLAPTEAAKAVYMVELRSLDDDASRKALATMEAKMRAGR